MCAHMFVRASVRECAIVRQRVIRINSITGDRQVAMQMSSTSGLEV